MKSRYGPRGQGRKEEEHLALELYFLEPMLEKAVPHDRQNKQTQVKLKGDKSGEQLKIFLRQQLNSLKASLKCSTVCDLFTDCPASD